MTNKTSVFDDMSLPKINSLTSTHIAILLTITQYIQGAITLSLLPNVKPENFLNSIVFIPAVGFTTAILMKKHHKESKYLHDNVIDNYILYSKISIVLGVLSLALAVLRYA